MTTLIATHSRHGSPEPGLAVNVQARAVPATILVSHGSALVAAGLLATLGRLPQCALRVWDPTLGPWYTAHSLDGVDLVVADAESFVPATRCANDEAPRGSASAPRVVLITARRTQDRDAPPDGADACLPLGCREDELFGAVRSLTGTALPPAAPADAQDEAWSDARPASAGRGGLAPGALQRVCDHVEARLAERIALRELADVARLSACHFSRAFKQSVGASPHRYVMTRRIAAAARLIRESRSPLTEIALMVGFSDQSHFTRVFASMMGEAPSIYRQRQG
jgi:AraC-like DNA-binding protein